MMAAARSRGVGPERMICRALQACGFGHWLHITDLRGNPGIMLDSIPIWLETIAPTTDVGGIA